MRDVPLDQCIPGVTLGEWRAHMDDLWERRAIARAYERDFERQCIDLMNESQNFLEIGHAKPSRD